MGTGPGSRAGSALMAFGAILFAASALLFWRPWDAHTSSTFSVANRTNTVSVAAGARRAAMESGLIGRLEIARLDLSVPVVEGTTGRVLLRGVGHVLPTAYPGEPDNVGLAGHRDTHFRKLEHVVPGDTIRIRTADGSFAYQVDSSFVVPPTRGDLLDPTGRPTLTLVTCYPFRWIGTAPDRFVVRATAVAAGI